METCPHCKFLVREGAHTCGVCHKALWDDAGVPAFAADRTRQDALAAHIGPAEPGFPISIVMLCLVGVLLAAAVWLTTSFWV